MSGNGTVYNFNFDIKDIQVVESTSHVPYIQNYVVSTISRAKTASASAANKTYNGTTESNGTAQTGVSGSNVSWRGDTTGTNAGSYTAYATPTSNYAWSDGTYTEKTITWTMSRRGQTAPVLNAASATYPGTATASVKTAGTVSGGTATAPGTLTWTN
jgi:hypothetical protein